MARLSIFTVAFSLVLSFLVELTIATASDVPFIELEPLNKHRKRTSFRKREEPEDGYDGLDLRSRSTFLWGAEASTTMMIANLTIDFVEDYEAIVDMDDFAGLVKSIDCTAPDLSLEFKDEKSFAYAHKVWDWVNSDSDYTFVLVASAEACAAEAKRQPFLVSHLDFDEANNVVNMNAILKTWEEIAQSYKFTITNEPLPPGTPAKRDGKTLSVAHDFSQNIFNVNTKGLDIGVDCNPCGTEGSLLVDVDAEKLLGVPVGMNMVITPQNIAAAIELSLRLGGKLTSAYSPPEKNIVSIPLYGIGAGDAFKLGLFLSVDLGFELSEWTGTAQASVGARIAIPNSAVMQLNLFGKGDTKVSGWTPTFSKIPPSLSAKIEGSAEAYAQVGIEVSAEGLGLGASVSLDMKLPYIEADFAAMADTKGVCGTKKTLGVSASAEIGAELYAKATFNEDPFWEQSLFNQPLGTLFDECWAFGPTNADATGGGGNGSPPPRSKKSKKPKSKTPKPSKKPTSKAKHTTTPVETMKPISSKKKRVSTPKATPTKPPKSSSPPKSKTDDTDEKSSHSSKHSASDDDSSASRRSRSSTHDTSASATATITQVTITTSHLRASGTDFSDPSKSRSRDPSISQSEDVSSSISGDDVPTGSDSAGTGSLPASTTPPSTIITSARPISSPSDMPACKFKWITGANNVKRQVEDCNEDVHSTTIMTSIPEYETIVMTCDAHTGGQACYHYYSAIENYPESSWSAATCLDSAVRNTGNVVRTWATQHPKNSWQSYFPQRMYTTDHRGTIIVLCERDEWPPAYFLPKKNRGIPQLVRWIPRADNGAAGRIWKGFCAKNDGGAGNNQYDSAGVLNTKLVKLDSSSKVRSTVNNGKTTTITVYDAATYTRAVMSMTWVWNSELGKPKKENDWHLFNNTCWPQAIATGNPGYVLLNEDKWYNTAGNAAEQASRQAERAAYRTEPDSDLRAAAATRIPLRRVRRAPTLEEGDFFGRDFNITHFLEDGAAELVHCDGADCDDQKTTLTEDDIAEMLAGVEELRRAVPERNDDAIPTAIPDKKWIAPVELRRDVSPDFPVATAAS